MTEISDKQKLLIVSLPRNEIRLAMAARDAGADILKVHINVFHPTAGTRFRSLTEEKGALESILAIGLPVGLGVGEEKMLSEGEPQEVKKMGFCFLDAYISSLRPYLYESGLPVVPALYPGFPYELLPYIKVLPGEWLEVAFLPEEEYGKELRAEDLLRLSMIGQITGRRLMIPTQRKLRPSDVPYLFDIPYVHAIVMGAIVTGHTLEGLSKATAAFRHKLDSLG